MAKRTRTPNVLGQTIEEVLRAIYTRDGKLDPDMIWQEARAYPEGHPFHDYFTWDVSEAARKRWVDEARMLIRTVRFEVQTTRFTASVPLFVPDPESVGNDYTMLSDEKHSEIVKREMIVAEFSRASNALKRARAVAVGLNMDREISIAEQHIEHLIGITRPSAGDAPVGSA